MSEQAVPKIFYITRICVRFLCEFQLLGRRVRRYNDIPLLCPVLRCIRCCACNRMAQDVCGFLWRISMTISMSRLKESECSANLWRSAHSSCLSGRKGNATPSAAHAAPFEGRRLSEWGFPDTVEGHGWEPVLLLVDVTLERHSHSLAINHSNAW
jgi:hypothetical protein